jgi:two-component system OmpR family response regulator
VNIQSHFSLQANQCGREKSRILIVDHDADVREALAEYLSEHGYLIETAANTNEMRTILARNIVDLVVLDASLPGYDYLDVCKRLAMPGGPAIIMTSIMAEETDKILSLELGADDYLTKPFCHRELLARVRSVLRPRRTRLSTDKGQRVAYEFAGWRLHLIRRKLFALSGHILELSGSEFTLLRVFLEQPLRPLTRDELGDLCNRCSRDRAIDVQVSRLRHKLEEAVPKQKLIRTIRRVGYVFNAQVLAQTPLMMQ